MYIQITDKCNMTCEHCAFSCDMSGEHMDFELAKRAIDLAECYGELISLGGGEPTLHPRFFDILEYALSTNCDIWLATNGSQTETMFRLDNIMQHCDWESFECACEWEEDDDEHDCTCEHPYITCRRDDQLSVELSIDPFHSPINERVLNIWRKTKEYRLRDVSKSFNGIVGMGRAEENGYSGDHCICEDYIIKTSGKVYLCGCKESPLVGSVDEGIQLEWSGHADCRCYKQILC